MMHPYTINTKERRNIIVILLIVSYIIMYSLSGSGINFKHILSLIPFDISIWFNPTPSTLIIFGFLYWLFNKHLWKTDFLKHLKIIHTPDISGKWKANLYSSHNGHQKEGLFEIHQTWTNIYIKGDWATSYSENQNANINTSNPSNSITLSFEYKSEPKGNHDQLNIHYGYNKLELSKDENKLSGFYFNYQRNTYGDIELTRINN